MGYLCDTCRKQFKEVLEYLESMGVRYAIDKNLVRGLDYYSRTAFEFSKPEEGIESLALGGGGRYDYLARHLGSRKEIPAVGASIGLDRILMSKDALDLTPRIIKKPKVYFIQLGFEAAVAGGV